MKIFAHLFLLVILVCSVISYADREADAISKMTPEDRAKYEKMQEKEKKYLLSLRNKIDFYGKVVDQDGQPAKGVSVTLKVRDNAWKWVPGSKEDTIFALVTDESGLFSIKNKEGHALYIENLEKDGYEYEIAKNTTCFDYRIQENTITSPFIPDPDNPVVFTLRQRVGKDYLLNESFVHRFRKSQNKPCQLQLFKEWIGPYGKPMNLDYKHTKSGKLLISCSFNEDYTEFELSFKHVVNGSGVYLSDALLYENPLDGYLKEVVYKSSMFKDIKSSTTRGLFDKKLYLYIRGPEKSYYSRIDLAIHTRPAIQNSGDISVQVSGKIYTNPEGRRNLDFDSNCNAMEKNYRHNLARERRNLKKQARKNKKQFDEKTFKEKVDKERKLKEKEVN